MYEALKALTARYAAFAMPDKDLTPEFIAIRQALALAKGKV